MEFYDDDSNSNDEGIFLFFIEWDEEKMGTDWEDEKTGQRWRDREIVLWKVRGVLRKLKGKCNGC